MFDQHVTVRVVYKLEAGLFGHISTDTKSFLVKDVPGGMSDFLP